MFASFTRHSSLAAVMAIALTTVACGGGKGNPLAPSTTAATPPPTATSTTPPTTTPAPPSTGQGASITGSVMGIGGGSGIRAQASGLSVQLVGTGQVKTVDDRGGFAFDDVPSGDAQLRFTGSGTDAAVAIGGVASQERISMTVSVTGSTAVVVSLSRDSAQELRVTGIVDNLDRAGLSLTVAGRRVQATGATKIEEGSVHRTFADLSNGLRVEVKGQPQNDAVLATQIEILGGAATVPAPSPAPTPTPAPGTGVGTQVNVRGSVSAISGSCPSLSFTVAGSAIRTSASTSFVKLTCADLRAGDTVEVEGVRDSSGALNATKVQAEDGVATGPTPTPTPIPTPTPTPTPAPGVGAQVNVRGAVVGLGGGCPALTFSVAGTAVRTTASTSFLKLTCAAVANGTTVEVEGIREANGTVVASKVQAEDGVTGTNPVVTEVEFLGNLTAMSGSAPSLTLTVAGRTVKTTGATVVRRSGNEVGFSALRTGQAIEVKGTSAADGSITATRLTIESDPTGAVSEVEFVGSITAVSGSAANGRLTVGGRTVTVTAATEYRGKAASAFAALKTGMRIEVKGVSQSDGSVLATRIDDED